MSMDKCMLLVSRDEYKKVAGVISKSLLINPNPTLCFGSKILCEEEEEVADCESAVVEILLLTPCIFKTVSLGCRSRQANCMPWYSASLVSSSFVSYVLDDRSGLVLGFKLTGGRCLFLLLALRERLRMGAVRTAKA